MDFFNNESEVYQLQALTIENRLDRVSLHGDIDLTHDAQGLTLARELKHLLDGIVETLSALQAKGNLPDKITLSREESVDNPFA